MLEIEGLLLPNQKKLDIKVGKDESFQITGANGAGKSLFLKSIARLQSSPYEKFIFQDKEIKDLDLRFYRSQVLYISPYPFSMSAMTVKEFIEAPLKLQIQKNKKHAFREDVFEFLKIKDDTPFIHLSSGQKQLMTLMRAISLNPEILLLDEPISHLDKEKINYFQNTLEEWLSIEKKSLLFVSHQPLITTPLDLKIVNIP